MGACTMHLVNGFKMLCSFVHLASTKVVLSSCSLGPLWKHWSALQKEPCAHSPQDRKVSKANSVHVTGLSFCQSSTITDSISHSKFCGILHLSCLSAKSQHTTWRGFPLRANLTNHLGWDHHFLSLCLLIRVPQQARRKVGQTVDKEWALGFNSGKDVISGEVSKCQGAYTLFVFIWPLSNCFISTCISEFLQWSDTGNAQQGNHHHPL